MRTTERRGFLALLGLLALAGCAEAGTQVPIDGLTLDEAAELAVVADPASLDVASEVHAAASDPQATMRFASAQEALSVGDRRRALEEAREARRLLARALFATGGVEAVEALIERIEDLAAEIGSEDDDVFDAPEALSERLTALAAEARALFEAGEYVRAAERALLGEQIVRHHRGRRHHPGDILPARARLAVALAGTAVQLAERLVAADSIPVRDLGSSNVEDHQNRWLAHARRMLALAERALENGHNARAVHFAEHAHWSALKAVILPGGVTEAELDAMVVLAHRLHAEAEVALGSDPSELEKRLFERAGRLIERGERLIAEGNKRGVAPVWRGAVISRWLMD